MNHTKHTALIGMLFFASSFQGCGNAENGKISSQNSGGSTSNTGGIATNTTGGRTGGGASATHPLTGGTIGTGGSSVIITGGTSGVVPPTGGAISTGGTVSTGGVFSSTGGTSPMTSLTGGTSTASSGGTTAIASLTGGAISTGGTVSTGGTSGTGGGSGTCVPQPRLQPAPTSSSWNCDTPVHDALLSVPYLHVAEKVVALSETSVWVLATEEEAPYQRSHLVTWDGNAWSTPRLLSTQSYSECTAMAYDDQAIRPTIWVGGHAECIGCHPVPLTVRITVGSMNTVTTQEFLTGLPSMGQVVSFWIGERRTFTLLNDASGTSVYELVDDGSAKKWSSVIHFDGVTGKEIWGTSPDDLFVVGEQTGESDASSVAFATHFNGCAWNQLSLPSDLVSMKAIHGSGGTVILVGSTGDESVRMVSSNLVDWDRSNSGEANTNEGPVWMTSSNAVLIGAESTDPNHLADGMVTMGTNPWKSFFVEDGVSWRVSSIARIPATNTYVMTSNVKTSDGIQAGVYRINCQEQ